MSTKFPDDRDILATAALILTVLFFWAGMIAVETTIDVVEFYLEQENGQ